MDGLKQRIIGALVLVSLAVIFVPMLFDEPHSERTSTTINIPEEPPFPEVEAPAEEMAPAPPPPSETMAGSEAPGYRILEEAPPEQPASTASGETTAAEPERDVVQSRSDAPDQSPEVAAEQPPAASTMPEEPEYQDTLEGAWVVQLGSFGNADNARRLRDQVREKGYGSHLQQVTQGDATLTRVFSGPFATKAQAEAAKQALDNAFGLNSLVTSGAK